MILNSSAQVDVMSIDDLYIHTSAGTVNRNSFEKYLIDHDCLEWSHDTSNYRGEHDQRTGTFTLEEYYQTPYVKHDLFEYLKQQNKTGKLSSLPSMAESLKKLINANEQRTGI